MTGKILSASFLLLPNSAICGLIFYLFRLSDLPNQVQKVAQASACSGNAAQGQKVRLLIHYTTPFHSCALFTRFIRVKWFCEMNILDPARANCAVPEEQWCLPSVHLFSLVHKPHVRPLPFLFRNVSGASVNTTNVDSKVISSPSCVGLFL